MRMHFTSSAVCQLAMEKAFRCCSWAFSCRRVRLLNIQAKKSNKRPTSFQCRLNYCNRGPTDFDWGPTEVGVLSTWIVCCCGRPGGLVIQSSCLQYLSLIKVGLEDMRKELLKRPHILICSAEFLSSEEVNPGHLLQATSVGMGIDFCASG